MLVTIEITKNAQLLKTKTVDVQNDGDLSKAIGEMADALRKSGESLFDCQISIKK